MLEKLKLPKLSDNEKKLLIGAGFLVVLAIYVMTILIPHYNQVMAVKTKHEQLVKQEKEYKATVTSYNDIETNFNTLVSTAKMNSDKFYPYIMQEKFIEELAEIAWKAGVEKPSYKFSELSIEGLNATNKTKAADPKKAAEGTLNTAFKQLKMKDNSKAKPQVNVANAADADLLFDSMGVTVEFTSNYDKAFAYITELSKRVRRPIIYDLNISVDKDGMFKTTIELKFFSIPSIEPDVSFDKWMYSNQYGKQNPFTKDGVLLNQPIGALSDEAAKKDLLLTISSMPNDSTKYDLFVSAKPITSDVQTTIVGKGGDSTANSYVYSDSENVEDVSIVITGTKGAYVATYSTAKETKTNIPINPSEQNIYLALISTARVSNTDISGMNLTITNSTDKKVIIKKRDEDPTRPRIKISTIGDVSVQ